MKTNTRKMLMGIGSVLFSYLLGMIVFFVLSAIYDFSYNSKTVIPLIFSVGALVLAVLYAVYWSVAVKNPKSSTAVIFSIIGCLISVLCLVLTFIVLTAGGEIMLSALINSILLVIGQIGAYKLGQIKIGG